MATPGPWRVIANRDGCLFVNVNNDTPEFGFSLNGTDVRTMALDYLNGDYDDSDSRVKREFIKWYCDMRTEAAKLAKPEIARIKAKHRDHVKEMNGLSEWLDKRRSRHIDSLRDKGWSDAEIKVFLLETWKEQHIRRDKRVEELEVNIDMGKDVEYVGDYMQNLLRGKFKFGSKRSKGRQYPSLKNKALTPEQKGNTTGEALVLCPNCSKTFIERIHETWHKIKCPKCGFFFDPQNNLAGTY